MMDTANKTLGTFVQEYMSAHQSLVAHLSMINRVYNNVSHKLQRKDFPSIGIYSLGSAWNYVPGVMTSGIFVPEDKTPTCYKFSVWSNRKYAPNYITQAPHTVILPTSLLSQENEITVAKESRSFIRHGKDASPINAPQQDDSDVKVYETGMLNEKVHYLFLNFEKARHALRSAFNAVIEHRNENILQSRAQEKDDYEKTDNKFFLETSNFSQYLQKYSLFAPIQLLTNDAFIAYVEIHEDTVKIRATSLDDQHNQMIVFPNELLDVEIRVEQENIAITSLDEANQARKMRAMTEAEEQQRQKIRMTQEAIKNREEQIKKAQKDIAVKKKEMTDYRDDLLRIQGVRHMLERSSNSTK